MSEQIGRIWNQTLTAIKKQINPPTFKTWFEETEAIGFSDGIFTIHAPNNFAKEWLESRYVKMIEEAISHVVGEKAAINFTTEVRSPSSEIPETFEQLNSPPPGAGGVLSGNNNKNGYLNPRYSFDNFVIGAGNRFAHAAALAVAERPSKAYNPFFVYGGVGLGKTHLLNAIGHYIADNFPRKKVYYVSTEKFTNDFINSIRDKDKIVGFQNKYRRTDVLLIDDIQFLENKEATQEEFFHTFNTLHSSSKQIVISCDRPPKDIATLEDRLRSRFAWGLITDIQPPDIETRIAILKKKAEAESINLSADVFEYIASRISSNIRELEGALTRMSAFASLTGKNIDLELAKETLKEILPNIEHKPISLSHIQSAVCNYFNVSKADLISNKRSQSIVYPRHIAVYLSRELTDLSLPKIGSNFGGRDHSTIMHSISKVEKMMNESRDIYNQVREITSKIKSACLQRS